MYYDEKTLTYGTLHQSEEISLLKQQLEDKKAERQRSLKSIIGYFYKR